MSAEKTQNPQKTENSGALIKILCDYLPLAVFFISYKFIESPEPLICATINLMVATLIALIISYLATKKLSTMALFSGLLLGFFGTLTIVLKNDIFIKMKPTIINFLFAAILFFGYFKKKPWLSKLLGSQIKMSDQAWLKLSLRWAWFFIFLACLNEVIWRSFSTDFWVQFKVFGMIPISLIFTILQVPFMNREMIKDDSSEK